MKKIVLAALACASAATNAGATSFQYTFVGEPGSETSGTFTIEGDPGTYELTDFNGMVKGTTYSTAEIGVGYLGSTGYMPDEIYIGAKTGGVGSIETGFYDFFINGTFHPGTAMFTATIMSVGNYAGFRYTNTTFTLTAAPSVPEPATWAMFIGGFGLIGAAMRRRQRVSVSFA